jgi:acyl-CoA reductase-like NAD-dependent aldehyde dehydrogenase
MGEVLCRVEQAGAAEVEQAAAATQAGFAVWSAMTDAERDRILHRAAKILRRRNREIAAIESGRRTARLVCGASRENGLVTLEHSTPLKSVYVEMGDIACPY